jgi:large subunit ribosomal protein L25
MRRLEITGYKRANLGKSDSKRLRAEGKVPCVLYGGNEQVHFHAPMILFRDLVYTPEAAYVDLNVEGQKYEAILQDIQFHPVSEVILHADFLELHKGKPIKMDIPVKFHGKAPGVIQGGRLMPKLRHVKVKALPDHMPESIDVDISSLELGKSIKVKDVIEKDFSILNSSRVTIATVSIPRNMRAAEEEEAAAAAAAEEEAAAELEEGEEGAAAPAEEAKEE